MRKLTSTELKHVYGGGGDCSYGGGNSGGNGNAYGYGKDPYHTGNGYGKGGGAGEGEETSCTTAADYPSGDYGDYPTCGY